MHNSISADSADIEFRKGSIRHDLPSALTKNIQTKGTILEKSRKSAIDKKRNKGRLKSIQSMKQPTDVVMMFNNVDDETVVNYAMTT